MAGKKLDFGLKFLHQAMKLESLHFGLFAEGIPRTLEGVKDAQVAYTKQLVGLIPSSVKSVLDVGCGVGGSTAYMREQGFDAEGLSPDLYHKEVFPQRVGADATFHHSGFEEFKAPKKYDCLYFSESPQYINKDRFWPKCLELTEPGATVVAADFFQHVPNDEYHMCFLEKDFVERAERAGFTVDEHIDITDGVLPNVELSQMLLVDYGQKLYQFATDSARHSAPIVWKLVRLFFGRKLKHIDGLLFEKLPRRLDPKRFTEIMRYAMYRFTRKK